MSPNNANATPQKPMYDPFLDEPEDPYRTPLPSLTQDTVKALVAIYGPNPTLTMSSRQIAEVTGKDHFNVLRDIEVMLQDLAGVSSNLRTPPAKGMLKSEHTPSRGSSTFAQNGANANAPKSGCIPKLGSAEGFYGQAVKVPFVDPQNGQTYHEYVLDKELTYTLVSGYSTVLRHGIVKRWLELEDAVREQGRSDPQLERVVQDLIDKPENLPIKTLGLLVGQNRLLGNVHKRVCTSISGAFVRGALTDAQYEESLALHGFYMTHARRLLDIDPDNKIFDLAGNPQGFYSKMLGG